MFQEVWQTLTGILSVFIWNRKYFFLFLVVFDLQHAEVYDGKTMFSLALVSALILKDVLLQNGSCLTKTRIDVPTAMGSNVWTFPSCASCGRKISKQRAFLLLKSNHSHSIRVAITFSWPIPDDISVSVRRRNVRHRSLQPARPN